MKKAFITGIAGQDGSYLSEFLLDKGYEVYGTLRRNSTPEHQKTRISHLNGKINTDYCDLLDESALNRLIKTIQPSEIYNLAAQSHVRISFEIPQFTVKTDALGTLNILEAYRNHSPRAKFYQASSSEMFGNNINPNGFQNENTPMSPTSPYGCAKLFSYSLVKHYRNAYKLFACNGILFNHESPRRGSNFVTNKIVKAAVRIRKGLQDKLELGNLDSCRDWGHAKDYVKAMNLIMLHSIPDDFVVATGQAFSIRDLCEYVFTKVGLNYEDYVIQDPKHIRPEELKYLKGDSTKFNKTFNWVPEYTFETLLDEMIDFWKNHYETTK